MQADQWHDHCKKSVEYVRAVQSRQQLGLTAKQMAHLHDRKWVAFWFNDADEVVRVIFRAAYPELFPPTHEDVPSWVKQSQQQGEQQ